MKNSYSILPNKLKEFPFIDREMMWSKEKDQMARKAVKKAVKRAATVKKQYVVGYRGRFSSSDDAPEFLSGVYDTLEKAKREAEESYDDGDKFFVYEVKLVLKSEDPVPSKLNWKSK